MKRAFLLVLCVVLAGCTKKPVTPPVPPPINPDFAITLTWNYDFTNNPVCSASVTKGCISGFTVGYLQGSAVVALPNNSVPVSACTGAAQPQTCKYNGNSQLPIGQITWIASATGFDTNGTAVSASTNSASATSITLPSPTNVVGTAQ